MLKFSALLGGDKTLFKYFPNPYLGTEFLSKHAELKVAHSGHLNNLVCVDFHEFHCVLWVGKLLNITHSNKLINWI